MNSFQMVSILIQFVVIVANANEKDLKLTILHLNDIHAHIEQSSEDLTRCKPGSNTVPFA